MIVFVLWTLGLLSGAIHPLGYLATVLVAASWTWFFLMAGMLAALRAKDLRVSANVTMTTFFLPVVSSALPFLLPAGLKSVVWGAGRHLFWRGSRWPRIVSCEAALHDPVYHPLHWFKLNTGEGLLWVALACLIGIVLPALWGRWIWLYSIANFDRLAGRPWREEPGAGGELGSGDTRRNY